MDFERLAADARRHWSFEGVFLNHGSFGACPRPVRQAREVWQERIERDPVRFFSRDYLPALGVARAALAAFVGADERDLVFVRNATEAVNAVVRSVALGPGDELLTTDHAYNACRNVLEEAAARSGGRVVVAHVPFPGTDAASFVEALHAARGPRTRLVLLDHVTSPTGIVVPLDGLVRELEASGAAVLVDGAHGPAMCALDLDALGASYYTGNLHKWVCAPRGAAFLHARADRQAGLAPAIVSHGYNTALSGHRFHDLFDWAGTTDPTAWLAVPAALAFLEDLADGGLAALRERNRGLALEARRALGALVGAAPATDDALVGWLAAVPLARGGAPSSTRPDPLEVRLYERHGIQVPIFPRPDGGGRVLRVSCHAHTSRRDVERLVDALAEERSSGASL